MNPYALPAPLSSRACRFCLEEDDVELVVLDLVESILQKSQDVLFEKHISSQVLPYAVQFAKDAFLRMAQWEFFDEDQVDPNDPIWKPDEELEPMEMDSWARGVLFPVDPDKFAHKPVVSWDAGLTAENAAAVMGIAPAAGEQNHPRASAAIPNHGTSSKSPSRLKIEAQGKPDHSDQLSGPANESGTSSSPRKIKIAEEPRAAPTAPKGKRPGSGRPARQWQP